MQVNYQVELLLVHLHQLPDCHDLICEIVSLRRIKHPLEETVHCFGLLDGELILKTILVLESSWGLPQL